MNIITEFADVDLDYLIRVATLAKENGQSLKISQHSNGTVMLKRGEGMWTHGFGKDLTVRPKTETLYLWCEGHQGAWGRVEHCDTCKNEDGSVKQPPL